MKNNQIQGTYGLVACGGNSSRMGIDKSMLTYYDKPQRYHMYELLLPFCEKVYISCNAQQAETMEAGYPFLTDRDEYHNTGPMAALLTAFTKYPAKNILLAGCDYPFLSTTDLQAFKAVCKREPAAFYNDAGQLYEPLLAWYPYRVFAELKWRYASNQYSLQHFLKYNKAEKFYPQNKNSMVSVDTHDAFMQAYNSINNVSF